MQASKATFLSHKSSSWLKIMKLIWSFLPGMIQQSHTLWYSYRRTTRQRSWDFHLSTQEETLLCMQGIVNRAISTLGHLHIIDADEYRAYQYKARSIERYRHVEEQVELWRKKISIFCPWTRKRGNLEAGAETSPLNIAGKSSKSSLMQSSTPLISTFTLSSGWHIMYAYLPPPSSSGSLTGQGSCKVGGWWKGTSVVCGFVDCLYWPRGTVVRRLYICE